MCHRGGRISRGAPGSPRPNSADRTPHSDIMAWPRRQRSQLDGRAYLPCCANPTIPYILLQRYGAIGRIRQDRCHSPEEAPSEAMINDVYNKRIIELAGNIPRLGRLPDAQASATAHSK